jgi:hypothetical protein
VHKCCVRGAETRTCRRQLGSARGGCRCSQTACMPIGCRAEDFVSDLLIMCHSSKHTLLNICVLQGSLGHETAQKPSPTHMKSGNTAATALRMIVFAARAEAAYMLLDMSDDQKAWAGSHQRSHVDIDDVCLRSSYQRVILIDKSGHTYNERDEDEREAHTNDRRCNRRHPPRHGLVCACPAEEEDANDEERTRDDRALEPRLWRRVPPPVTH